MERVLLVGVKRPPETWAQTQASLEELARLVDTAGGHVADELIQAKDRFDPATLIGPGKVEEIVGRVRSEHLHTVVFDEDLAPAQQRNLEKEIPAKILDRTRLILDIFAQRARTREGILQVELAQLTYRLPRLTGLGTKLSQQVGGIGTRGPGERMLEVDRRHIRNRIGKLRMEISRIRHHREQARDNRFEVPLPQVALVGYTNAGKSTLLNRLMNANGQGPSTGSGRSIYADDKLFATLDPTTRRVRLLSGRIALFTDTVGFIQKLPTHLVASFRATLEEIAQANLLVHVVDASNPHCRDQTRTVSEVIKELKADKIPCLTVYNKIDRLGAQERQTRSGQIGLPISAVTGEGLDQFLKAVEEELDCNLLDVTFELPHNRRGLLSRVYKAGKIIAETPTETGTRLHVRIDSANWQKLSHALKNC